MTQNNAPQKTAPQKTAPGLTLTRTGAGLVAAGDIDLSVKAVFVAALNQSIADPAGGPITVDLVGTDYIDSAGLEALVSAYKRLNAEDRRLCLRVRAGGQVDRVLYLGQFRRIMDVERIERAVEHPKPSIP